MNININIPIRLLIRIVRVLERISTNYELVNHEAITAAKYDYRTDQERTSFGRTFYQSDEEIHKEEVAQKVKEYASVTEGML